MVGVLAVTAHPDDESFVFGGLLAVHARRGGRAGLLCLTDGQAGRMGGLVDDRARLGEVRRGELLRAAAVLGIPHVITPGLRDGALAQTSDAEGAGIVARHAEAFGADVLLTFGPEGASGHADHKACFRWTRAAAGERRVYVASWPEGLPRPDPALASLPATTVADVSELGDLKRRAFLEHRTQRDHLELFDRIMEGLGGKEYYHRLLPPWPVGAPPEAWSA